MRFTTKSIAFGALMAALGTTVMLTGGIVPIFTYCSPLIAALFLIPVSDIYKKGTAWSVWAVTAILSLLIGTDKEASFFYLFLGWYPIVKPKMDKINPKWIRATVKTSIFSVSVLLMYYLTCNILGIDEIIESFSASFWINAASIILIVICMLLYDKALLGVYRIYIQRIKSKYMKL